MFSVFLDGLLSFHFSIKIKKGEAEKNNLINIAFLKQNQQVGHKMSRIMRKLDFYLCENKGADQLCSNCTADQRLCFRYSDSTIPLLFIANISSI